MSLLRRRLMQQMIIINELTPIHTELEYYQAGELICHSDLGKWGYIRDFYKVNDGLCIVGCAKLNGYFCPIAIGKTVDSVKIRYDNTYTQNEQISEFVYANSTWFVTSSDGLYQGTQSAYLINNTNYVDVIQAAQDLLNYYYGVI